MKPVPASRALDPVTARSLGEELRVVFPKAALERADNEAMQAWKSLRGKGDPSPRIFSDAGSGGFIFAFLYAGIAGPPQQVVSLRPLQPPDAIDLQFANLYVRVFDDDLKRAPQTLRDDELWETLSLSRVTRTIARLTAFSTLPFLRWLSAFEAAAQLRYEGSAFHASVFMTKQGKWITQIAGSGFVPFERPLGFRRALLGEKWVRTLAGGADVGLVGLGHHGNIIGVVVVPDAASAPPSERVLPTKLRGAVALVRPGTMAFLAADNGDLYVVLPSGAIFVKSQGIWQYLNYGSFQQLLSRYVPLSLARIVLQLSVDLSFARRGSLFCLPTDIGAFTALIPDHSDPGRPNRALRQAGASISVDSAAQLPALRGIAGADGAVVIGSNGRVVDAACMIGQPDSEALKAVGLSQLQRFEGARTTAAWNASVYGVSIKISDDGPISLFAGGELVGQIG